MILCIGFFFFKQKTAYEMRISDWSSDVCSSDLSFFAPPCSSPRQPMLSLRMQRHRLRQSRPPHACSRWSSVASSPALACGGSARRSEEHTSELQSLMRISYAVFCLKKKKQIQNNHGQTDAV